jgi:hypothetical protein
LLGHTKLRSKTPQRAASGQSRGGNVGGRSMACKWDSAKKGTRQIVRPLPEHATAINVQSTTQFRPLHSGFTL